jgi:hypothetical protein
MIIVSVKLFSILMNLDKIVLQAAVVHLFWQNYPANTSNMQYIYSLFLYQSLLNKNIYVRKQNDNV